MKIIIVTIRNISLQSEDREGRGALEHAGDPSISHTTVANCVSAG